MRATAKTVPGCASMSTDRKAKSRFVLITVRIGFFPFFVCFPLRCLSEIIEGLSDNMCLYKNAYVVGILNFLESTFAQIRDAGPLDIVDVDVKSPDERVVVRILTR